MTQAVIIKSKSYGIHLVLNPKLEFYDLTQAVIAKFKEAGDFFKNAQIGISFEGYDLSNDQAYELIAAIENHTSVNIICIMEDSEIQQACLLAETESYIRNKVAKNAIFHYGSLKPGEELHSDTGLVILGDVPAGARAVAGGSILVFGALDGFAQAGAYGDSAAYIAALSIDTGQLQIANILLITQENGGKGKHKSGFLRRKKQEGHTPQIAHVRDGHVIMEPYTKDLF